MIILSYILPCYNTAPFITQCIESLYHQGFDESLFEVIFVNNATKDNSEDIVLEIQKHHSNLVYVKLDKNVCSGGAYNAGLKIARGKYIQIVDSDDYLVSESSSKLVKMMEEENLEILQFNIESFDGDGNLTYEDNIRFNGNLQNTIQATDGNGYLESALNEKEYSKLPVPAYRKIILRELFTKFQLDFTPTTIGTDFLNNIELLSVVKRMKSVPTRCYMFRYNPFGVTKSRMNADKVIYAFNNYSNAFRVLNKSSFSDNVKHQVENVLTSTFNYYLHQFMELSREDKKKVYNNIEDMGAIYSCSNGLVSMLIEKTPSMALRIGGNIGVILNKIDSRLRLCR